MVCLRSDDENAKEETFMFKRIVILLLCLLTAFGTASSLAEGVRVTDMCGREVTLDAPATRVVALDLSACDILCALDCEDLLVGRGKGIINPESISDVPDVPFPKEDAEIEEILALEPQVVFLNYMEQSREQWVKLLEENGVKVVVTESTDIQDVEGVYCAIELVGALVGREAEAQAVVDDMQATFAQIAADSENTGKTVFFELPMMYLYSGIVTTAGTGTCIDEIAEMCGLTNAFADVEGYVPVDEEQVLERDPDYIVNLFGLPYDDDWIMDREGWSDLKAVVNGNVLDADYDMFWTAGPSLKDAALSVFHFVHGVETGEE